MTTSHKQNPFGILEHSDSSDEDEFHKSKKTKAPKEQKEVKKGGDHSQKQAKPEQKSENSKKAPTKTSNESAESKEKHLKTKEQRKEKGVAAEPHPHDRKSGTAINPWEKKAKRTGGGKFNAGATQEEQKEGERDTGEGQKDAQPEEEAEDKSLTLEEYYKRQQVQQEVKVNEAKAKVSANDLLKEMGTATKLTNRHETKIDDRGEIGKKKKESISTAELGLNTEHAEFLGFKTGFKTFTERKPLQEKAPAQASTTEGAPPSDVKEGEEKKEQAKPEGEKPKEKGGYKGGKKNYNSSYKPRDNREEKAVKPNFEDSSAFPKLE